MLQDLHDNPENFAHISYLIKANQGSDVYVGQATFPYPVVDLQIKKLDAHDLDDMVYLHIACEDIALVSTADRMRVLRAVDKTHIAVVEPKGERAIGGFAWMEDGRLHLQPGHPDNKEKDEQAVREYTLGELERVTIYN